MKLLYDYLIQPDRTVQLFNHQKDWRIWWLIIAISGLISTLKWATIGMSSLFIASVFHIISLVLLAIVIDASGQLLNFKGQLKDIIYWLPFATTITWLIPSMSIIQHAFLSVGSLLILAINIIYGTYIWKTLKRIYNTTTKKLLMIVTLPLMLFIILTFAIIIFVLQKVVTI